MTEDIFIVAARRTPIGAFQGALAALPPRSSAPPRCARRSRTAGVAAEQVDEVMLGCVLPAGLGQAPARQASIGAGVPDSVPATTVNKVCGSGMKQRDARLRCDPRRLGRASWSPAASSR